MRSNRSLAALVIALALHFAVFAVFWTTARDLSEKEPKPPEKRFGVSLSEELLPEQTEPPLPSAPRSVTTPSPIAKSEAAPPPENPPQENGPGEPLQPITPEQRDTLPRSVLHHYGETFFELSAGEQHYIIDNLQRIRKINEIVGTRLLRERPDEEIDPSDSNIVEFSLHPDGTLSDIHLHKNRVGTLLDELTLQTITLAHPRYPKPDQTTRIRIRVYIVVK